MPWTCIDRKLFLIVCLSLLFCSVQGQYVIVNDTARTKHLVKMYSFLFQNNFELAKAEALPYCRDSAGVIDYPFMRGLVVSCSNLGQTDTCFLLMNQLVRTGSYSVLDRLQMDFQLGPLLEHKDSVAAWQKEIDSIYFYQSSLNNPNFNITLAKEILSIYTADQWPRYYDEYFNTDSSNRYNRDSALIEWLRTDSINQVLTGRIFDEYGWPTAEMVGFDLSQAIWFPLQHGSVSFQKKHIRVAKNAYKNGDIPPNVYATLVDRLAVNQGKKQLYGTQFQIDQNGNYVQYPIKRKVFLKRRLRKMNMENLGTISM
jgi:hypothetical protein